MTLAEDSAQIEYRDFIVDHLENMRKDMSAEDLAKFENFKRHWNLLRYLEKSFESGGTFKQNKAFGTGKERIIVNESEIKALTIEKIVKYPEEWKSKIATTLFFTSFGKHPLLITLILNTNAYLPSPTQTYLLADKAKLRNQIAYYYVHSNKDSK